MDMHKKENYLALKAVAIVGLFYFLLIFFSFYFVSSYDIRFGRLLLVTCCVDVGGRNISIDTS